MSESKVKGLLKASSNVPPEAQVKDAAKVSSNMSKI